jgi:hypothetical protein
VKLNNYNHKTVHSNINQRQAADLEKRASDKHLKTNTSIEPTPSIIKTHLVTPHMLNFNKIEIPKQKKRRRKKKNVIEIYWLVSRLSLSSSSILP